MERDQEGLHAICNVEHGDRMADLVFVHGLGGAAHSTWQYQSQDGTKDFWPEELGKELEHVGIWSFGYAAGITKMGAPGLMLEQRGKNLAVQLLNAEVAGCDVGFGSRPLFFVTHSMGGLVVKELIVSSQLSQLTGYSELVEAIQGIVFCGTPHRGSAFASAAGTLGKVLPVSGTSLFGVLGLPVGVVFGRMFGTQPHVKEMEKDAVRLDTLNDKFRSWQEQSGAAVQAYAESHSVFAKGFLGGMVDLGKVVERSSANPGVGSEIQDVEADHFLMVKLTPTNQAVYSVVFRGVRNFVREELENEEQGSESRPSVGLMNTIWKMLNGVS